MTERIPLDHLTSDQLDALYDDLARYEEVQGEMNENATTLARRVARAEAAIERVRQVANRLGLDSPWGRSTADRILAALTETPAEQTLAVTKIPVLRSVVLCDSGRHLHHPGDSCAEIDEFQAAFWAKVNAGLAKIDTFTYADGPTLAEDIAADRNHDVRQDGE